MAHQESPSRLRSIIIVVATDAPLIPTQLERVVRRATAETMTGINDRTVIALPHDRLREVLKKNSRLAK